jgi:hypothetical protein
MFLIYRKRLSFKTLKKTALAIDQDRPAPSATSGQHCLALKGKSSWKATLWAARAEPCIYFDKVAQMIV